MRDGSSVRSGSTTEMTRELASALDKAPPGVESRAATAPAKNGIERCKYNITRFWQRSQQL